MKEVVEIVYEEKKVVDSYPFKQFDFNVTLTKLVATQEGKKYVT